VLATLRLRIPEDVPLGASTYNGNTPLDKPLHPNVTNSTLLYTYADDGPGIVRFIDPLMGCGTPDISKGKVVLTGVPGKRSPVTYSTNGLWATNPFVDGSNPDASINISPLVLEKIIPLVI
tara:strand:- start:23 stop:385 length:363 start_codon:yes stop_codon:yes gene_type:complete